MGIGGVWKIAVEGTFLLCICIAVFVLFSLVKRFLWGGGEMRGLSLRLLLSVVEGGG
jgi:preprotein translocase subunit SecF